MLRITPDGEDWQFDLSAYPGGPTQGFRLRAKDLGDYFATIRRVVNDAALHPASPGDLLREAPLPDHLEERLRSLPQCASGTETVLLIDAAEPFSYIPWELFPRRWNTPELRVVRRVAPDAAAPANPHAAATPRRAALIIVTPVRGFEIDARREADALSSLFECTTLLFPTLKLIQDTCEHIKPVVVHWIGQGGETDAGYRLRVADDQGDVAWWDGDAIVASLAAIAARPTIFLNMCGSGFGLAQAFSRRFPGAFVLGWYGIILTQTAVDVALSFYSRRLAGDRTLTALAAALDGRPDAVLLASTSQPEALAEPGAELEWKKPDAADKRITRGGPSDSSLEVELALVDAICPALLANGQSPIRSVRLKSRTPRSRLRVCLTCDTGSSLSTWSTILDLAPGDVPLKVDRGVHFPALHELMLSPRIGRRQINITLAVSDGGKLLAESTGTTRYLSPIEWLDEADAWPYIPSYVLPDSDAVKALIKEATPQLQARGGNAFDGRAEGDALDLQVECLYDALKSHHELKYVPPPGAPVYLERGAAVDTAPDDRQRAVGQRVRFPNEVVEHNRGTCHDLALFLAACAEHVHILPLMVLIPGHTLFGYWRRRGARREFWDRRREDSTRTPWFGDRWVFCDTIELMRLVSAKTVRLVETVAVTDFYGRGDFAEACDRGVRPFLMHAQKLQCAVDVWSAREHVEPLYRPWMQEVRVR